MAIVAHLLNSGKRRQTGRKPAQVGWKPKSTTNEKDEIERRAAVGSAQPDPGEPPLSPGLCAGFIAPISCWASITMSPITISSSSAIIASLAWTRLQVNYYDRFVSIARNGF